MESIGPTLSWGLGSRVLGGGLRVRVWGSNRLLVPEARFRRRPPSSDHGKLLSCLVEPAGADQ